MGRNATKERFVFHNRLETIFYSEIFEIKYETLQADIVDDRLCFVVCWKTRETSYCQEKKQA
jgi:hypothetical protein